MKIRIAENIKSLRKQHSFTQEQLAEALGVTTGAVYKWESGQSVPEVKLIMELADLFEVSVDTLLGYDRQKENIENRIQQIQQYVVERDFDEAAVEAEKALKKYPNNFDVVYTSAMVYMLIFGEQDDKKVMRKSVSLFQNAISLLYQNKESHISEASIMNLIGNLYIGAGEYEKALEILKEHNECGVNHDMIGFTYAMIRKPDEAKLHLYQSYSDLLNSTIRTFLGMVLMFGEQKNEKFLEAGLWLAGFLDSIRTGDGVTFIDKLKAVLFAQLSLFSAEFGRTDEAEHYITEAVRLAHQFDNTPDYSPNAIQFIEGAEMPAVMMDGLGETAAEAIEWFVFSKAKKSQALEFVKSRFAEMGMIGK